MSYVIKNLQPKLPWISICTPTKIFVLSVKTVARASHLKKKLEQHRITHQADPGFICQHKGCDRSFKDRGDLNQHLHSHDDVWYKCDSYPYKNKDKRNRDSHMRIHQEQGVGLECYHCEKCGKAMRFSTQLRHHKETSCEHSQFTCANTKG